MPYAPDGSDVPARIKGKPAKKRRQFAKVWNSVYRETQDEGRAYAAANDAIKEDKMAVKAANDVDKLLYAPIVKVEEADDGSVYVYGKVAGEEVDLDKQITDDGWLSQALPDWYRDWANVREMHQPSAVGVAKDYAPEEDGHYIGAKIVDAEAVKKVQAGVYKGYSIGIKSPVVVPDAMAKGGRIKGGKIVEVSIVDHPANEATKFTLVKAAEIDAALAVEAELEKKEFSQDRRDELADKSHALPDGSFPIENKNDLGNAIKAYGRAKNKAAAKAHIKKRARALGATDMLPDDWKLAEGEVIKGDEQLGLAGTACAAILDLVKLEADKALAGDDDEVWDMVSLVTILQRLYDYKHHEEIEDKEPLYMTVLPDGEKYGATFSAKNKAFMVKLYKTLTDMLPDLKELAGEEDDMDKEATATMIREMVPDLLKEKGITFSDQGNIYIKGAGPEPPPEPEPNPEPNPEPGEPDGGEGVTALKAALAEMTERLDTIEKRAQSGGAYAGGALPKVPEETPADAQRAYFEALSKSGSPALVKAATDWLRVHSAKVA